jgi:hypothetical protein
MVQDNFANIVKSDSTTSQEMLSTLNSELAGHAVLSQSCTGIVG